MGRPKKIRATVTAAAGSTMTMERPKTVPTIVVQPEPACTHCGSKGTSKNNRTDSKFLREFGFQVIYMVCHSAACMKSTNGEGRRWQYRKKVA